MRLSVCLLTPVSSSKKTCAGTTCSFVSLHRRWSSSSSHVTTRRRHAVSPSHSATNSRRFLRFSPVTPARCNGRPQIRRRLSPSLSFTNLHSVGNETAPGFPFDRPNCRPNSSLTSLRYNVDRSAYIFFTVVPCTPTTSIASFLRPPRFFSRNAFLISLRSSPFAQCCLLALTSCTLLANLQTVAADTPYCSPTARRLFPPTVTASAISARAISGTLAPRLLFFRTVCPTTPSSASLIDASPRRLLGRPRRILIVHVSPFFCSFF